MNAVCVCVCVCVCARARARARVRTRARVRACVSCFGNISCNISIVLQHRELNANKNKISIQEL